MGALRDAAQVEDGFAERLGRDRPRVHAHAADDFALLADPDPLAELGGLDGGALPGGAGPEDEEIELLHERGILAARVKIPERARRTAGPRPGRPLRHGRRSRLQRGRLVRRLQRDARVLRPPRDLPSGLRRDLRERDRGRPRGLHARADGRGDRRRVRPVLRGEAGPDPAEPRGGGNAPRAEGDGRRDRRRDEHEPAARRAASSRCRDSCRSSTRWRARTRRAPESRIRPSSGWPRSGPAPRSQACVFVGDSRYDEEAARRAPVRFLGTGSAPGNASRRSPGCRCSPAGARTRRAPRP